MVLSPNGRWLPQRYDYFATGTQVVWDVGVLR